MVLVGLAAGLYVLYGLLEGIRSRVLLRLGQRVDAKLSGNSFEVSVALPIYICRKADQLDPMRDHEAIGWGWFYLSTTLDEFSRYIIAWELCATTKATEVADTLDLALQASGCKSATVVQKPRLLSENGSSYVATD